MMTIDGNSLKVILGTVAAAKQLGLGTSTLHKWRVRGVGPRYVELSANRIGYRPEDLDDWVRSRVREPGAAANEVVA